MQACSVDNNADNILTLQSTARQGRGAMQAHLAVQRLRVCSVSDNGGEAVQAHSAAIQLGHPPSGLPAIAGAALQAWGAVIAMTGANLLLPEDVGDEVYCLALQTTWQALQCHFGIACKPTPVTAEARLLLSGSTGDGACKHDIDLNLDSWERPTLHSTMYCTSARCTEGYKQSREVSSGIQHFAKALLSSRRPTRLGC